MNPTNEQPKNTAGSYVIPVTYLSKWYYQLLPHLALQHPAYLAWSETSKQITLFYEGQENSPVFKVPFSAVAASAFNLNQIELKVNGHWYNLLYREVSNTIVTAVAPPVGFAMAMVALNGLEVKSLQTLIGSGGGKVRKTNVLVGVLIGVGIFVVILAVVIFLAVHSVANSTN